jgi:hypothetical protein
MARAPKLSLRMKGELAAELAASPLSSIALSLSLLE